MFRNDIPRCVGIIVEFMPTQVINLVLNWMFAAFTSKLHGRNGEIREGGWLLFSLLVPWVLFCSLMFLMLANEKIL